MNFSKQANLQIQNLWIMRTDCISPSMLPVPDNRALNVTKRGSGQPLSSIANLLT